MVGVPLQIRIRILPTIPLVIEQPREVSDPYYEGGN